MMVDAVTSYARNGLLRKFQTEHQLFGPLREAKSSEDASFLAITNGNNDIWVSETFVQKSHLHNVANNINGFVWSKVQRNSPTSLTKCEKTEYLVILDFDFNVLIYSCKHGSEKGSTVAPPKSLCIQLIPNSIFSNQQNDVSEKNAVEPVFLLSASHDDLEKTHTISCIVDDRELIKIVFKDGHGELLINAKIPLPTTLKNGANVFNCYKQNNSLLLAVSPNTNCYIIDVDNSDVLQCFKINQNVERSSCNGLDDSDLVEDQELTKCAISSNLRYIVVVDKQEQVYVVSMCMNEIVGKEKSKKADNELPDSRRFLRNSNLTIDKTWETELANAQEDILEPLLDNGPCCSSSYSEVSKEATTYHSFEEKLRKSLEVERYEKHEINIPSWTSDFTIEYIFPEDNSILIAFKPKTIKKNEFQSVDYCDGTFSSFLLLFDLQSQEFTLQRIPDDAIVAISESKFFPHCILTHDMLYLPTFNTSQEQLFSGFIQYSGISEAEKICRSNQWNQFSIPLHSLEVGLQHRQIDTISFFLKTRDKAFSRYWRSISLPESTAMPSVIETSEVSSSPSSLKSLFSPSIPTSSVDPSELHKAVDMLLRSIHQNSKGRHKKNFFEALLRMTIDFLNNLIRDGVDVLETIDCHSMPSQIGNMDGAKSFTFVIDIPETIAYLVECLMDIRQFITDLPNFYYRKHDQEISTKMLGDTLQPVKVYVEEEILAGHLGHLQEYILRNEKGNEISKICDGSLSSLVAFGLKFVFRMLLAKDIKKAIKILQNLGKAEKDTLKKIFEHTLDRNLREYLITEFLHGHVGDIVSEQDRKDIKYLHKVESLYPCNVVEEALKSKSWTSLLAQFQDEKVFAGKDNQLQVTCSSLRKRYKEECTTEGNYSELIFKWIQEWDCASRSTVILDAASASKQTDNLGQIVNARSLWEYLMNHNADTVIRDWIQSSMNTSENKKREERKFPRFEASLIGSCLNATSHVQQKVLYDLIKLGMYTDEMIKDFRSTLKVVSEASTLFGSSESLVSNTELKSKFHLKFIEYCLKNDLKEALFLYLDHHCLYPVLDELQKTITVSDFSWLAFLMSLRNLHRDDLGCLEMSLSNAAAVFCASEKSLIVQLCKEKPLIVLATAVVSSLKLLEVFYHGHTPVKFNVDVSSLKTSLLSYDMLHSAVFSQILSDQKEAISMYRLLKDNTKLNANAFFNWQLGKEFNSDEVNCTQLPHFSSPELVNNYGLVIQVRYPYYLKQSRPVYAYLAFMRDCMHAVLEKDQRKGMAVKNAYKIAVSNFDKESIVCTCAVFLDFLGMNSWPLRIDIECANYVSKNWRTNDASQVILPVGENLNTYIVSCLKRKNKGRQSMLRMLVESVENALERESIDRTSFDAIIFWRLPILFAKMNKLNTPPAFLNECAENGRWFQAVVFIQVYQFEQAQVLSCLKKHLKNTILKEHLLAVIKNAKTVFSGTGENRFVDQKATKKATKLKQSARKDFRAQFYFSLEKGVEKRLGDEKDRLTPIPLKNVESCLQQVEVDEKQSKGSTEKKFPTTDEHETRAFSSSNLTGGKIVTTQVKDNVLNIMLECEESGNPCRELMSCAFSLSQPFLVVLAACYQNSDLIDCLCAWLILNLKSEKRLKILETFNDMDEERYQWKIESLFIILSDLIDSENNAATIIAQGFKIFLEESSLLHFFLFFESFVAKHGMDICIEHINTFSQKLKEEIEEEREANLIRVFFMQRIPIKIFLKCHSKFFQRKLLQLYIDAGFNSFQMSSVTSLERLNIACEATWDTEVDPDFSKLVSNDEAERNAEEESVYSQLLESENFEKALGFAKFCNLPAWKVVLFRANQELSHMQNSTLWQNEETRLSFWFKYDQLFTEFEVSSSVAGSFFQTQATHLTSLSYCERALLLSIAFRWYKEEDDVACTNDNEAFLNQLEKQIWIYKIKSEIEKSSQECMQSDTYSVSIHRAKGQGYDTTLLLSRNQRTPSALTLRHANKCWELLQPEHLEFVQTAEDSSSTLNELETKAFNSLVGELLEECEITQARRICAFFCKTVPDLEYVLSCIFLAQGTKQIESLDQHILSIIAKGPGHSLSFSGTYEGSVVFSRSASFAGSATSPGQIMNDWVLIEELQNALEKLWSKCNKGRKCCERVLVCFKISKMIGIDYEDIAKREPFMVLRELIYSGMDKRRHLCRQFIKAFDLPQAEVAAFVAEIIIHWLKLTCNADATSFAVSQPAIMVDNNFTSEDMIHFIQLVDQPSALGMHILETAKSISVTEDAEKGGNCLSFQSELLIRAHDCFTLSCNMEGISEVLRAARLCTLDLVKAQAYSLMVRILTGIGRFKEMTYVFEALAEQHHFELLFRKNIEKEKLLKAALLDYIKKFHADDKEKIDMLSKRFGMYREVGEQLEETAHKQIRVIKDKIQGNQKEVEPGLVEIAKTFSYAADNYVKVDCLRRSQQCRKLARLAELQIRLFLTGKCIIGLEKHKVNQFLCNHTDFYEALIIADAYGFNSVTAWVDPLYQIVVVKGDMNYLKQYLSVFQISGTVMMEIASRYRSDRVNSQMGENLRKTLSHVKEVKLRYKIAHELNMHDVIKNLLKGPGGAFLRDTVFTYS